MYFIAIIVGISLVAACYLMANALHSDTFALGGIVLGEAGCIRPRLIPRLSPPCNAPLPPRLLYCNAFIGYSPPLPPRCALYNGPGTSVRPAGSSVQGIGLPSPLLLLPPK